MIVDSPLTFGLTVGADRRIPQEDDARVLVPPVISAVALMAQIHTSSTVALTPLEQSLLIDRSDVRTNQAGLVTNFITLSQGLWELELNMASTFNFTPVPPNATSNRLRITYKGVTTGLIVRHAAQGSHQDFNRLRLLLDETGLISTETAITNFVATDSLVVFYLVNAIKVI